MKKVWVILPLKDLVQAKTRLAGVLAPFERRALAQAMVEDVLTVLTASGGLAGVLLVSDDPAAQLLAHRYAVDVVEERYLGCQGLNDAVESATEFLRARGVEHVMVMHSDLPLLQEADVDALLQDYEQADDGIVIAPDRAGTGTNVMMFAVNRAPELQYGEGSCQAHSASAKERGMPVSYVHRENLQSDVDNPEDVIGLWQHLRGSVENNHCRAVLFDRAVSRRLAMMERTGIGQDELVEDNRGQNS